MTAVKAVTYPTLEPMVFDDREPCRPRQSGIYQIICKPTGKVYVGSAVYLAQRKGDHRRTLASGKHHNQHLQRAWDKYGPSCFDYSVLEHCSEESLTEREQHYIDKFNTASRDCGFNINPKAKSALGYKHTEETRRKISENARGVKRSEETKRQMSISRTGRKMNLSPEQLLTRGKKHLGHKFNLGRVWTEEQKAKLRGGHSTLGLRFTEEQKDRLSAAHHPFESEKCSEIRQKYIPGVVTMKDLAIQYGCHQKTISNIINHSLRAYQCA